MRLESRWRFVAVTLALSSIGSLVVFWGVIKSGAMHAAPDLEYDTSGAVWTNAWVAHAISHFQNPFFSPNLMHPFGLNLLANVYNLGFSTVFAPVTWALNPVASLNAQLLVIPVVNSLVMGLCLRRFIRAKWIALVGGLMWGFSPFVVNGLSKSWTNVTFLVLPPIVLWLLTELIDGPRWSPRRLGMVLAAVTVFQYFVDTEILLITAIGASVGLAIVFIQRRSSWAKDWPKYRSFAGWSVGPSVLVLAAPIAYGIYGPHPMNNWVRSQASFRTFVSPLINVIYRPTNPSPPPNGFFKFLPNPQYLGAGIMVVIIVGAIALKLAPVARSMLVVGVFGLWMSVGYGPWWSPFPIIEHLPIIHNMTVTRFIMLTWFASIVLAALVAEAAMDRAAAMSRASGASLVAVVILTVAFAPPLAAVATRVPLSASSSIGDSALPWVLNHRGHHVVMGFPFPASVREMLQQAKLGDFSFDMPGGQWPQIFDPPEPFDTVNILMWAAGNDLLVNHPKVSDINEFNFWLRRWGVTDVIVPRGYIPAYSIAYQSPRQFVAIVTEALGAPRVVAGEWVWIDVQPRPVARVLSQAQWTTCTNVSRRMTYSVPGCVVASIQSP